MLPPHQMRSPFRLQTALLLLLLLSLPRMCPLPHRHQHHQHHHRHLRRRPWPLLRYLHHQIPDRALRAFSLPLFLLHQQVSRLPCWDTQPRVPSPIFLRPLTHPVRLRPSPCPHPHPLFPVPPRLNRPPGRRRRHPTPNRPWPLLPYPRRPTHRRSRRRQKSSRRRQNPPTRRNSLRRLLPSVPARGRRLGAASSSRTLTKTPSRTSRCRRRSSLGGR